MLPKFLTEKYRASSFSDKLNQRLFPNPFDAYGLPKNTRYSHLGLMDVGFLGNVGTPSGPPTPDFEDGLTDKTKWTLLDTARIDIDTINHDFDINIILDSTDDTGWADPLGVDISDTKWVLRYPWKITQQTDGSAFGINGFGDITGSLAGSAGDVISFIAVNNAQHRIRTRDEGIVTDGTNMTTLLIGTQYYSQLQRRSATLVRWTLFTDLWSTEHDTDDVTIASTVDSIRFLSFGNRFNASGSGDYDYEVDADLNKIQFWNNKTSDDL